MKSCWFAFFALLLSVCGSGCFTLDDRLPSEDIEAPVRYAHLINVLKNPDLPANSREKYEAAMELVEKVDFSFTRETRTVDTYFYYREAFVDTPGSDKPVFTFNYAYGNRVLRISFFTYKMFVTRVEILKR